MRLGKATSYGLFAMVYLAEHPNEEPIQGRSIARAIGIPGEYLLKILQQLVRCQVMKSERGRGGGFFLGRAPSKVSLLEVVEAIEGPLNGELVTRRELRSPESAKDRVEQACTVIADYSKGVLKKTTLKHLMQNGHAGKG